MARIIVAAIPAYGHFAPMRAIASDLIRRGHQVTILTGREHQQAVAESGATFAAFTGAADLDVTAVVNAPERLALTGLARVDWDLRRLLVEPMADQHHDLQRLIAQAGDEPVLVVADAGFQGTIPLTLGAPGRRPAAIIGIGLVPFTLSSIDTAPTGMGLPPDSSAKGRARNRGAYAYLHGEALGGAQALFVEALTGLGVAGTPVPFLFDAPVLGPDRFLQLAIEELSYKRSDTPSHVRFVGALPSVRPAGTRLPSWWSQVEAAEKVVVVTQGTLANQDFGALIEPTLAALADLPVLVVAATGRPGEVRDVPANARVTEFVPFDDLLPFTDVLVTNGGFGAVQQSLRYGTPMVLAGQTEEKLEGNVRVAATGAAINLATDTPAVADIRAAVQMILSTTIYQVHAQRLATEYAKLDALDAIARTVDELTPDPNNT
jgi:MGT family glycosyltransferase